MRTYLLLNLILYLRHVFAICNRVNKLHNEWCDHESFLFFWNLYKSYDRLSKPTLVLDVDAGCVTAMEYHPRISTVLAVGTARGKLIVVNTRFTGSDAGGESYVRATNQQITHQDAVSNVHWMNG